MIHHLAVSTLSALICAGIALALPRSAAAMRHLILLIGILRFAAYTPWLNAVGADLVPLVPENRPPTPRPLHATLHLLADPPEVWNPAASPPRRWIELKQAGWWIWFCLAAFGVGAWLGGLAKGVRAIREASFWERDLFLQVATKLRMDRWAGLRIVAPYEVPGAQGWLRPRVLLPDGLLKELSEPELEPVLAHELAHLRRRDPLIAGMVRGIVSIFWFHPLLWWMERRMLAEREIACDELTLACGCSAQDYIAAIAKICRASTGGIPSYASVTGANLAERIGYIRSFSPRRSLPAAAAALPLILAALAAFGPIAGGLLRAEQAREVPAGNPAVELQTALMLDANGRTTEAIRLYQRLAIETPDNYVVLNNLAYLLAQSGGDLHEALTLAEDAHKHLPGSLEVDDTLGWVELKLGQPDRAILAFRDPVLTEPNNFSFRSHMAQALDALDDPPVWARELRGLIFNSGAAAAARTRELLETISR